MADKGFESSIPLAIITGGTTGIGGATARELSKRGYDLLLVGLSDPHQLEDELNGYPTKVRFLSADLSQPESSALHIINTAVEIFGRIDLLVNCAGMIGHKPVSDVVESDWDTIFAVNFKAAFFLAQQAHPHLVATGGNIINISSTNAVRPAKQNQLYDSMKAALNNLTQGLALEFRDSGVRVNAVMPGGTRTDLTRSWLKDYLGRTPTEQDLEIPSVAEPEQIATVVAALASKDMAWVNGVTLAADGGFGLS